MEAKQERINQITKERKRLFLSATKLYAVSFKIHDKAADHIDALGDPMSAVMIREAIK